MKLKLEVDIDYIDEEMNLDETIKQNIINTIVSRIETKVSESVKKVVDDKIDTLIVDKVNALTDAMFKEFITRPVTITDKYGSNLKSYENVEAIVKEKFDNFMTERVDDKGNATTSTYGTTYPRITFIVNKQLSDFANKFTTDAVAKVSAEIKTHVTNGLTQKLGSELMKVLKVEQMLQLEK